MAIKEDETLILSFYKIKLQRENIMLVIRDYNSLMNLITEYDQQLFGEQLEKINAAI